MNIIKMIAKYIGIALLALIVLVLIIAGDAMIKLKYRNSKPLSQSTTEKPFLTNNFVNLAQIAGISKFRSCQGHDYPGKGENGKVEFKSSMKHYIAPRDELREQLNVTEVYSPVDGEVVFILNEKWGDQVTLMPSSDTKWSVVLFHIDRVAGIDWGSPVKAGQLIGYANVKGRHDFDIAITRTEHNLLAEKIAGLFMDNPHLPLPRSNYLVSAFDYMADDVKQEFAAAGFPVADMSYTQEYRQQNPCNFENAANQTGDWAYLPGLSPEDRKQPPPSDNGQVQSSPPAVLFTNPVTQ